MSEINLLSPAQMKVVLEVSRLLTVTTELDPLLRRIAEAAVSLLDAERASIFLHDAQTNELATTVALESANPIRVPVGSGVVGCAFATGEVVHVPDAYADARFNRDVDRRTGFKTRDLLAAPMADVKGKALGVLQVMNKRVGSFADVDRLTIQLLADQAGVAIQRHRLQQQAQAAAALHRELDLARRVQQDMLPKSNPHVPGIEMAGWARPASVTAGDCYDFWKLPDGRLGVFLADACGHGLGPTLVVSQVRTLVRTLCDGGGGATGAADPCAVLSRVNARLVEDLSSVRFATAFLALVAHDGTVELCSAGQGPVLVREGAGKPLTRIETTQPPLGVDAGWHADGVTTLRLSAGGMLAVASDGILEAPGPGGEQFGPERTVAALASRTAPLDAAQALRDAVTHWQGGVEAHDDQTCVIVSLPAGG